LTVGAIVADRSFVDTVKVFPINLEIQTMRTYTMTSGRAPASRTGAATLSLNTSVVLLPEEPMQPRYADERVGYFSNRITEFSDELMGQLIRFVSSHEVGHTLGLRHNMIASQATPVEKLRDKAWVEQHGHTSSIMDYARFNYVAQLEDMHYKDLLVRVKKIRERYESGK